MVRGCSFSGGFDTLQTLRSPFNACDANISDFCLDDDACHAKPSNGDGPRDVVRVCRTVNVGRSVAIKIDPFWYLK